MDDDDDAQAILERRRQKHREDKRRWALANPEKIKASQAKWAAANRERAKALAKIRRDADPERYREKVRRWQAANPGKVKASKKRWALANPEKMRLSYQRWLAKHRAIASQAGVAVKPASQAKHGGNGRKPTVAGQENHNRSLNRDVFFALVDAAVSKRIPEQERMDIVCDILLALFARELHEKDVPAAAERYVAAHYRKVTTYGAVSLDQTIPGTDSVRRIDTIANDDPHF